MTQNVGELFICGTPIGNLDDITFNLIKVLKKVDIVAAEDTRRTIKLLNHLDIKKKLVSYHQHNETESGRNLIEQMKSGKNVALVSDAGMPGISDPGQQLIRLAVENSIKVSVISGPTALINALLLSGLPADKFVFEGFLPSAKNDRRKRLEEIGQEQRTIIFYEAPHRLCAMLEDIWEVLGDRKVAVAKELTKLHEQVYRGSISDAVKHFSQDGIRGEFVIVVEGAPQEMQQQQFDVDISIKEHITLYLNRGLTKKDAIKAVAKDRDIPKREVYKHSIDMN